MGEQTSFSKTARLSTFFRSFSASTQAVLVFAIPFTIIDAIHYLTAGTTLTLSLPIICLLYVACGMLSARISVQMGTGEQDMFKLGAAAGVRLWALSTIINVLIGLLLGISSLGVTLLFGLPYICLCAPVLLAAGSVLGGFGAWLYSFIYRRSTQPSS